jgi:replicative DNA helicase Mcm
MSNFLGAIKDTAFLLRNLSEKEKEYLDEIRDLSLLSGKEILELEKMMKQKKAEIKWKSLGLSFFTKEENKVPVIAGCEELNNKINSGIWSKKFKLFAGKVRDVLPKLIAPEIVGMDEIKKVAALQLFSTERFHILLLGDPGTGKTEILRSANEFAPISSFGLGSGTSGVGLSVTVIGKEIHPGLLPMADNGLCCIDELNLMKKDDRASLYNAMEKGFVTYDKGSHHYRFDARIKVLATANPKGDEFTGETVDDFKKSLPFDPALLSRFHVVFFVRKPRIDEFIAIAEKIVEGTQKSITKEQDIEFIKNYVKLAEKIEIEFNPEFKNEIKIFAGNVRIHEAELLINVTPRVVVGIVRLAIASARMELRSKVEKEDVRYAIEVFEAALKV